MNAAHDTFDLSPLHNVVVKKLTMLRYVVIPLMSCIGSPRKRLCILHCSFSVIKSLCLERSLADIEAIHVQSHATFLLELKLPPWLIWIGGFDSLLTS